MNPHLEEVFETLIDKDAITVYTLLRYYGTPGVDFIA